VSRRHDDDPILITEAQVSFDDEFAIRKRRYSIIMACRIPCLVLAGVSYMAFGSALVAVLLIVLSVPLPWIAVLIANDRLPKKAGRVNRYQPSRSALTKVSDAQIIEAAEVLESRASRAEGPGQQSQDDVEHDPPRTGTDG
jgi:hypothetical protein